MAPLGWINAKAGKRTEALQVLDELLQLAKQGVSIAYGISLIYYQLGEKDRAFEWMERSYQDREIWLQGLAFDPLCDDVRSDPRGQALLKKMGLRK